MKEKLTRNLGMKILSLILALIVWLVVVNIDNPTTTRLFRDIDVEIQHEDAINSLNKVYEIIEGSTVDVTVKGKRSVLDNMKDTDIKAAADLSNLSYTNAVPIVVTCSKSVDSLSLGRISTLKVNLEDVATKQLKVTIVPKGSEEAGYFIGTIKAKPNIIQVTGAESLIARIDQVRVDIDISNVSEDFHAEGEPKAYDADGRSIGSSNLSFSTNKIELIATVLKTKTVNIDITTEGIPLEGYQFAGIDYEPKKITIAGESSALKDVNSIPISMDIGNAFLNIEEEIDLTEYIPAGVSIAEDSKTVIVNIAIEKLQEKNIDFNTNDIEIKNLPTGVTFSFDEQDELSVAVLGLSDKLSDVTKESLNPYINLLDLGLGTHEVEVMFSVEKGVKIKKKLILSITLKDVNDTTTTDNSQTPEGEKAIEDEKTLEDEATPEDTDNLEDDNDTLN